VKFLRIPAQREHDHVIDEIQARESDSSVRMFWATRTRFHSELETRPIELLHDALTAIGTVA